MRDALKNLFGKELILDNGDHYLYTIQPYEMKNVLGTVVALLKEYSFTQKGTSETFKLYRTKEGNWYNISQSELLQESTKISALKFAVNKQEELQNKE